MRFFTRLFCFAGLIVVIGLPLRAAEPSVSEGLKPFVEKGTLAGAVVLVASPEKVLATETVGYADREAKTPMRSDNLFWIASMSKPITSAALMMLVDEKKVELDAPVEKYLPEFSTQMLVVEKDKEHVLLHRPKRLPTVRDLLRHTSGMPFQSALENPTLDRFSLRDGVCSYAMTPLQHEPGTEYAYSNAGINTAGRIIEVVSKMPYEEFLEKRLIAPLGMKDTTFWPNEEQVKRLAKSYRPNKENNGLTEMPIGQLQYPLTDRKRQPMPAGGLFATAADVAAFCQMVLSGGTTADGKRILSEASVREMTSIQTGDISNKKKGEKDYGLGLSTTRESKGENGPVVAGPCGHGGAYATNMWIDPDRKLITVFMVQHAGFPNNEGGKIRPTFEQAAVAAFGK
ncbi:MAG TPA: serine hydrolase domain-containing protein [Gemmata sp.]|jgi:CubicO group peptidase (beta-lactamase class C family)|nr:serine hydrolase domain-containing protein [Gemmata sp.]